MFSAIQDFARDAFHEDNQAGIRTLSVGETTVWVERGPHAFLAAVIRGEAPGELRDNMQLLLEKLHKEQNNALRSFQGDLNDTQKDAIVSTLDDCFDEQYSTESGDKQESKKAKSAFIHYGLLALLIAGLCFWLWQQISHSRTERELTQKLQKFESALIAEPGIAVSSSKLVGDPPTLKIRGLADPLAVDVAAIVKKMSLEDSVSFTFAGFFSSDMKIIRKRFALKTRPPESVQISIQKPGVLALSGESSVQWLKTAKASIAGIPGLNAIDTATLKQGN